MYKQPSAIIIARHGVRLDQSDKNWRATAPDPYDSPLSYGGWIQCQTLGARIDKELQALADQRTKADLEREEQGLDTGRRRKRRKIVIHSSPFKRCIQTSIAIAAGLKYPSVESLRPLQTPIPRSSLSNSSSSLDTPPLQTSTSNEQASRPQPTSEVSSNTDKHELRIDPFLGEWLSPSYFEEIEPPPGSEAMMQKARDYMQLLAERINGARLNAFEPIVESPMDEDEKENLPKPVAGLRAMALAGHSMPHRTRTTSFGRDVVNGVDRVRTLKSRPRAQTTTYSPPVPTYSLAPQDPIPLGFVPHARDACVNWQSSWNSDDMGWGSGGEYPEEWSAMHIRFRQGLQNMLAYYQGSQRRPRMREKEDDDNDANEDDEGDEEEEEDLVLVLVTHQAGANALIRLLTGAPALHDIGTASLTLAVRRATLHRPPSTSHTSHSPLGRGEEAPRRRRRGSLDLGLADDFEMRIIASTEHLRYGSNPLGLNSPRLGRSPAVSSRRMVGADSLEGFSIGDPLSWRSGSSDGSLRPLTSRRTGIGGEDYIKPVINTGLWGTPAIKAQEDPAHETETEDPPVSPKSRPATPMTEDAEDLFSSKPASPARSRSNTVQIMESTDAAESGLWNASTLSASGLWGSSSGGSSYVRARSPAKRRWSAINVDSP